MGLLTPVFDLCQSPDYVPTISTQKGSFIAPAASQGIALLFPDTSPRGANIEGEDDDWDFGTGAGFYLDATDEKYSKHYNMYTFITEELPKVLQDAGLPIVRALAASQRASLLIVLL
jgi:S-formylglutathione hydrolase FrmB